MAANIEALQKYSQALESVAVQCDKDAAGFNRALAAQEKLALEAQKWISHQEAAVQQEISRLRTIASYEAWKALANPRSISLKAGEVAEQLITQAYVQRFNEELRSLGAGRVKVELVKTRATQGKVLHQLRLSGATNGRTQPESVLSEGERRVIGLAAFLADVSDKPQIAPFIFDDPISSLDHEFEWHVATRLAELAKERQVLVFTHRLSLYGAMEDVAKKLGDGWKRLHYKPLCIEAFSGVAGHPVGQAVWNSKTKAANNILLTRLDAAKKAGEQEGGDVYRIHAQSICTDFRKLLERTVEDDLLNEVVKRHRRGIQTDNRLSGLSLIEPDDCHFIDELMTKYSCFEHSQSHEAPVFIPEEAELRSDIENLKSWREQLAERRKQAAG